MGNRQLSQAEKLVYGETSLLENVGQGGAFDRTVGGDRELECLGGGMFLEADMTSLLPDDNPTITLQGADNPVVRQAGSLAHTATSSCSACSRPVVSSSTGSR